MLALKDRDPMGSKFISSRQRRLNHRLKYRSSYPIPGLGKNCRYRQFRRR